MKMNDNYLVIAKEKVEDTYVKNGILRINQDKPQHVGRGVIYSSGQNVKEAGFDEGDLVFYNAQKEIPMSIGDEHFVIIDRDDLFGKIN